MALDQAANFVRDAAAEAVDDTQTTISVGNASEFADPANGEYNVVIWDSATYPRPDQDPDVEIMRVTGYDTGNNTITVSRGQEGTAAAAHPDGSAIHHGVTAKVVSDIDTELQNAPADVPQSPEFLVSEPGMESYQTATLDDTESHEVPVHLADGETLEVYRWGAYEVADPPNAPTGLTAEIADAAGTAQVSENTVNTQDTTAPVASYENTSTGTKTMVLRAYNGTGGTLSQVGMHFGYRVV